MRPKLGAGQPRARAGQAPRCYASCVGGLWSPGQSVSSAFNVMSTPPAVDPTRFAACACVSKAWQAHETASGILRARESHCKAAP